MSRIEELVERYLNEGWGAYGQKRELEKSRQDWEAMFNKYDKQKKATAILKDLRQKNWKAEYAEKELIKKGLALTE
jgi:trimethylamine:corrinoid methyltransferase-like protein